jgi:hypothetical protein
MSAHEWPTRDEWAKRMRTPYFDRIEVRISDAASDYATQAEIQAEIDRLHAEWCELGRELKRTPKTPMDELSPKQRFALHQRSGDNRNFFDRDDIWTARDAIRERRKKVNGALRDLRAGNVPLGNGRYQGQKECPLLYERWSAARRAAYQRREAEIRATPIDDEAWAKELERRKLIEQRKYAWTVGR